MATEAKPSRRERRKEARLAKNKKKYTSWINHHQSLKSKESLKKQTQVVEKSDSGDDCSEPQESSRKRPETVEKFKNGDYGSEPQASMNSKLEKGLKRKKRSEKGLKSSFFEYLQMEMGGNPQSAEEDLRMERRLAKKLKVKNGRLRSVNDDIDILLEDIPTVIDNVETRKDSGGIDNCTLSRKSEDRYSENEDLEDEISADEEDEELDSQSENEDFEEEISADEEDEELDSLSENEDLKDEISTEEEDEEFDSLSSSDELDSTVEKITPKGPNKGKGRKTMFEEYLENELYSGKSTAEADLKLERKLAKKLKVKAGKLGGDDDEINMLLEGISSVRDSKGECEQKTKERLSSNIGASGTLKTSSETALQNVHKTEAGKYVAPHLRSQSRNESTEYAQLRKRVRGLLNRLSETNVESIAGEISSLVHSVSRSTGSQIIIEEVVASCSGGPRGSEQYSAVFAAFVSGMACLLGIDFGAKLLAHLAKSFEEEYLKEDNLSLRNLTLLLSYLYVFGVCSSELIYDFLIMLGKRLEEVDVSTVLTILQCCGMRLRGDDPVGMKNFITSVQSRVNELKAASENRQSNLSSKRMEFMLETICDIKNNKKRSKDDTVQHTSIKKWLQKLRSDDILIRGLKWSKLLDPNKKGQWWSSGDISSTTENVEEVASTIDKEVTETKKMLELASSHRMNTDARRAIFCVIMSGEDYVDAFEKLLRLDLPGKQDREIMRVLVECCLQEKVFNKYYCALASKLCSHDKNHKFTLQYCLWDHFKELESMSLNRSMHLAKFTAEMIGSFSLSLAVLKVIDLNNIVLLTPKKIMHFRMLFEALFELPNKLVWNIFTRIAVTPEHEALRNGIVFFIDKYVVMNRKDIENVVKMAKKALNNIEGVVM